MDHSSALVIGEVSSISRASDAVEHMELACEDADGRPSDEGGVCDVEFSTAVATITVSSARSLTGTPVSGEVTIPLALGAVNTADQGAAVERALESLEAARPTSQIVVFVSPSLRSDVDFDLHHMAGWATVEADDSLLNLGALAVPGAEGIAGIGTLAELEARVSRG